MPYPVIGFKKSGYNEFRELIFDGTKACLLIMVES